MSPGPVEERLAVLEERSARIEEILKKKGGGSRPWSASVLALLGAVLGGSLASAVASFRQTGRSLEAHELILKDAAGRTRLFLSGTGSPGLSLLDEQGNAQASLTAGPNHKAAFALHSAKGTAVLADDPSCFGLYLLDSEDRARVSMVEDTWGSQLSLLSDPAQVQLQADKDGQAWVEVEATAERKRQRMAPGEPPASTPK